MTCVFLLKPEARGMHVPTHIRIICSEATEHKTPRLAILHANVNHSVLYRVWAAAKERSSGRKRDRTTSDSPAKWFLGEGAETLGAIAEH